MPRSTLQVAAICITLFFSFVFLLGPRARSSAIIRHIKQEPVRAHAVIPYNPLGPLPDLDEPATDPIWHIQNRTLGFQKIYAISMPHRTDKRDFLTLMGVMSDLDITFMDGVNGSEMNPKSQPPYWKGSETIGEYGVWRAHLNVYQHMLQNHIETALILEDDVDWDVFLKAQMMELARGVRAISNCTSPTTPYGDNWQVLALGHIGAYNKPNKDTKYYVTENDPTVIAESRRTWSRKPLLTAPAFQGEHTRVVMEIKAFAGFTAYGLSRKGAAAFLYDQSMLPNAQAVDIAMMALCKKEPYPFYCMGSYPMLFGRYRAIGPKSRDSDRRTASNEAQNGAGGGQAGDDRLEPENEFNTFPLSLNIGRLLRGETIIPTYEPKTDLLKEADMNTFVLPRGKVVTAGPAELVEVKAEDQKQKQKQKRDVPEESQMRMRRSEIARKARLS